MNEATPILPEQSDASIRAARNARYLGAPLLCWGGVMLVGGLFLGWVGAMGSYSYPPELRIGLWVALCAVAAVFAFAIEATLTQLGVHRRGAIMWWATTTAALALAMTPVIYVVNSIGTPPPLTALARFAVNSSVISAFLVAARMIAGFALAERDRPSVEHLVRAGPAILKRLSVPRHADDLVALQAEGHYVRVHLRDASELVLMRLRDAISEIQPVEGYRVHRSWWVAEGAIRRAERDGGKIDLVLANELAVPVSRSHRSALREAGVL